MRPSARGADAEWLADAAVHVLGLLLAPFGVLVLTTMRSPSDAPGFVLAMSLYAAGIVGMITASAVYNIARPTDGMSWLRRIDHAAIFIAIAGTYTPFVWLRLPGAAATWMCVGVWLLALAGASWCLVRPSGSSLGKTILYLLLGWIGLPVLPMLIDALRPATLGLILAGGILYTVGAMIHRMHRLRFHDAVWHLLVLAAAACHLMAVRLEFAGAVAS